MKVTRLSLFILVLALPVHAEDLDASIRNDADAETAERDDGPVDDGGLTDAAVEPIVDAAPPPPSERARRLCIDAIESFEAGHTRTALAKLKAAVRLSPNQFGVVINLADYYKIMGPPESAIKQYQRARELKPNDLSVAGNLVDLLLTDNPPQTDLDQAQRLVQSTISDIKERLTHLIMEKERLKRTRKNVRIIEVNQTIKALDKNLESFLKREIEWAMRARAHKDVNRVYYELASLGVIQDLDDLALKLGTYYREIHQEANALRWYKQVLRTPKLVRQAKKAIAELEHQQSVREMGLIGKPTNLNKADQGQLDNGRELLARAKDQASIKKAIGVLEDLAKRRPLVPQIQRLLGNAHQSVDQIKPAEKAYLRAVALDPTERDNLFALAEFYEAQKRWKPASAYFGRVLRLTPTNAKLHLRQSQTLERAGWYSDALLQANRALDMVLEDHPLEPALQEQRNKLEGLAEPSKRKLETTADRVFAGARAYYQTDQFEQAVKEARKIPMSERTPKLWLLIGQSYWRRALKYERADRPQLFNQTMRKAISALNRVKRADLTSYCQGQSLLIQMHERAGRPMTAIGILRQLKDCESLQSDLDLVRLELNVQNRPELPDWISDLLDAPYLWTTYWRLSRLQKAGVEKQRLGLDGLGQTRYKDYAEPLSALLIKIRKRLTTVYILAAGIVGPFLGWFLMLLRRRFRGKSLVGFLAKNPSAQGDVHRILSAVRHEVLKHNTTALQGLLANIDSGNDISDSARWCRHALLGDLASGSRGAKDRLDSYVRQLEYIAQSHRYTLNLKHKDSAFSAILNGFGLLAQMESEFYRAERSGQASRPFKRSLRKATDRINGDGYRELVQLLKSLRGLNVTEELCLKIFDSVRNERSLMDLDIADLDIQIADNVLPIDLPVARQDFEDMLRNPIRNAIQATHQLDVRQTIVVGLGIDQTLDPITGESSTNFTIKDQSPSMITDDLIHQQAIESGLGLMASLVSKYEGSVRVAQLPGPWTKAVVISLPCQETAEESWRL